MKKVFVKGIITDNDDQRNIYDILDIDATSPMVIEDAINKENGRDLEVQINSPGGNVFAGSEIYSILKDYKGHVTVKIVGLAASAASVISMAGDTILISPAGQIMIHNSTRRASGDYRTMDNAAVMLKSINESIANAYALRSGLDRENYLRLMDSEKWFTAQDALNHRLVDGIMFEDEKQTATDKLNRLKNKVI